MTNPKFKVGDLVYCPTVTNKIVELKNSGDTSYPFEFSYDDADRSRLYICTADGKDDYDCLTAVIFHATEENHAMLEQLHGIKFEKPKKKPTPKEIIKHLLTKQDYVVCWVSDENEDDARVDVQFELIYKVCDNNNEVYIYKGFGCDWCYAIPIDLQGNEITEIKND